jgi:DNA-binding cell septation regulator SpoVG
MNIKIIRINKVSYDKLKAFVDLCIDGICIKGFSLVEGQSGLFLSNPQEKGKDGKYHNTVWFDSRMQKDEVEKYVLSEYAKLPV